MSWEGEVESAGVAGDNGEWGRIIGYVIKILSKHTKLFELMKPVDILYHNKNILRSFFRFTHCFWAFLFGETYSDTVCPLTGRFWN